MKKPFQADICPPHPHPFPLTQHTASLHFIGPLLPCIVSYNTYFVLSSFSMTVPVQKAKAW